MNNWRKNRLVFISSALGVLTFIGLAFFYFGKSSSKQFNMAQSGAKPLHSIKEDGSSNAQEKVSQNIVLALGSEPRSLDPRKATDANGMRIGDLLFHSLVYRGPHLKTLPSAAQSWSYKDKIYSFHIDKDLKFSNERKITKEDLLFSFEEYRSEKSPFSSAFQIIESVNVEEKKRQFILKVKLKKESAKFLSSDLPVLKILPKQEILSDDSGFQKAPFGTGPFQLESNSSSHLVLKARPSARPAPKINRVIFKIIRDDFTRFQKMLNGEIDIAQSEISFQKISYFEKKKDQFQIFRRPGLSMTYLLINFQDECLRKKETRQAIVASIDRLKIIQHKLRTFAHPATTILGPHNYFLNPYIKNSAYNLEKARDIFHRLPLSCRQKTFSFKTSSARSAVDHGRILSLQLRKAGFKVKIESFEWGTFYGDLNAGRFQFALLKWVGATDPDIYRVAFHSREHPPKGRNRGFYENKLLDKLLDQGITEMNREKRQAIYSQVQKIIHDDLAFIPLWHEDQITVVKKDILNYYLSDNGDFRFLMKVEKEIPLNLNQ